MCQVLNYYHFACQHTFRYRLVNRCSTGFSLAAGCCKANENQVIGERPFFRPRWCMDCKDMRIRALHEVYDQYVEEVYEDGERQGWSRQMINNGVRKVDSDRIGEIDSFLDALAEVEDREEAAGTANWPRQFDSEDDSELEQHRQELSDDEEFRAAQEDSQSEESHSVYSANANISESISDESSESEAEALPHFGFFRSQLPGRSRWYYDELDNSFNYDDTDDCSVCADDENAHDEIQPDTMSISDETEPADFNVHVLTEPHGSSGCFDEAAQMDICDSVRVQDEKQDESDGYEADAED